MTIPNLEFVGFVPFAEIGSHFDAARVFVNTSDYEGFPNTFLQSWARGIPTVSFVDTGSRLDGRKVVNVATDLDDMAAYVQKLMQDDEYWNGIGRRARACYERFHTPNAALDAYERLFYKAVERDAGCESAESRVGNWCETNVETDMGRMRTANRWFR